MCGIAGAISFKSIDIGGPFSDRVEAAIKVMRHRGPDEVGFLRMNQGTIGMCRLAIVDVLKGKQPNQVSGKRIYSVFNGEIYNFQSLRNLLVERGYKLNTTSDSECIPLLYEQFGPSFVKKLNGMFAIAIWDIEANKLLLFRDRLGKKPLWYSFTDGLAYFSSELKGMVELGVAQKSNLNGFPQYLRFGYINAPNSPFESVYQVKPGHYVTLTLTAKSENSFWQPATDLMFNGSYREALDETRSLLREAVEARLFSERPLGMFLSGGIDSSLIAALLVEAQVEPPKSFTIGFVNKKYDESKYAASIAKKLGLSHKMRVLRPDPAQIFEDLKSVMDQPFADSSLIPMIALARFAREEVVVALGGDGGDEVFGGYDRYRYSLKLDNLNFMLLLSPGPFVSKFFRSNARLEKLFMNSGFTSLRQRYLGLQSLIQKSELEHILLNDLRNFAIEEAIEEHWIKVKNASRLRTIQLFDLNTYLPGDLLYKADIATMASGLELRSPFLDYRVVEFGLSLPDQFKIWNGAGKRITKDLLGSYLSRADFDRPKRGFGIPRAEWLRGPWREMRNELLLDGHSETSLFLNKAEIKKLLDDHDRGRNRDRIIWPILMWELWSRQWVKT